MTRMATQILAMVPGLLVFACNGKTTKKPGTECEVNDDCEAGEICDDGKCFTVCGSDPQCGSGEICVSSRCVKGSRSDAPEITALDGDSPIECSANHTHCLRDGIVIEGHNLEGAGFILVRSDDRWPLIRRDGGTDSRVEVDLPDVAAGDYVLRATNSAGQVDQSLSLLQGEPGEAFSPTANELVGILNGASVVLSSTVLPVGSGATDVAAGIHGHDVSEIAGLSAGDVTTLADLFPTKFAANAPPMDSGTIEAAGEWTPMGTKVRILKTSDRSLLKVTYSTSLRSGYQCINSDDAGETNLEIRMDGGRMSPACYQHTYTDVDGVASKNYLVPYATVCIGENIPKGLHELDVWIFNRGCGTAWLNWFAGQGLLLVEEIQPSDRLAYTTEGDSPDVTATSWTKLDAGREVTYTKQDPSSLIKVTYADTLRVSYADNGGAGSLEVRVDDLPAPGRSCRFKKHDEAETATALNNHNPMVMECILEGLSAGEHTFNVWYQNDPPGVMRIGWGRSSPLLMVEEIEAGSVSYTIDSDPTGSVSGLDTWNRPTGRSLTHTPRRDNSTLKITFSDTFRATYNADGQRGEVEIRVDSESLPTPCKTVAFYGNSIVSPTFGQNHRWPLHLVCLARGLDATAHTFEVYWRRPTNGGELSLGWERGQSLLMVEEI